MTPPTATIHASAVLVGDRAVLIRGPSGAGKSRLAFDLILAGRAGQIAPAMLIGDDRLHVESRPGEGQRHVLVRPSRALAGLIEIRGLGIRRIDFAPEAIVGLVVDLDAEDAARLPAARALRTTITGVVLPRVPVAAGWDAFRLVAAQLLTRERDATIADGDDCPKGIGNHISPTLATG